MDVTHVLALLIVAVLAWAAFSFNRFVRLRNQMRSAWADIDVQLRRRHDLVPQLVSAVKAYAAHERATLEAVTELRARAVALDSPEQLGRVESELEGALGRIFALREDYPELKASENFMELQRELVDVEDHLQYARRFYNGAVRDLNTTAQTFPDLLVARVFGVREAEFFQANEEAYAPVRTDMTS